ncbi:hypothetical protein EJ04DRAFT_30741 [Polyplosphaeria fusca]|uniref:Rhodopsin domain-containing protein n=1 Tax=Polyplosphaeria fusca TaxID=682080 RepID=A0A9P4QTT6_9PLEO|nr:hypothetical protein EJ04DRAFT_30741 [Polyplosphaeria fusca]
MAVPVMSLLVTAFTLTSLSTIVVMARFYSRCFLVRKLSSSDWVMLAAVICTWGSSVTNYYQAKFQDYSHVHDKNSWAVVVTGGNLSWWIHRLFYIVDTCLIKTSILLFYNYIASSHKSFHRITKGMIAIILFASIGMLVAAICSCIPVADAWSFEIFYDSFFGEIKGHCYNPNILWFFSAGFNLVTDTMIWLLPPIFLLNLQALDTKRKLELIGIFSIGIVAVIASAIRLWVLTLWTSGFIQSGNQAVMLLIWGQVEQHAGIISASIPFLRPLYRKLRFKLPRRSQSSPTPKLIAPHWTPEGRPVPPRTPIIPSPSPTLGGSSTEAFRVPSSPLTPIAPFRPEEAIRATV